MINLLTLIWLGIKIIVLILIVKWIATELGYAIADWKHNRRRKK